jgi:hypothetical protein
MLKSLVEKLIVAVGLSRSGGANSRNQAPDRFRPEGLFGGLQRVHLAGHVVEAGNRVSDVDRKRPAHRGQPVAELAVLVLGANRDRDQRLQLELVGVDVAVLEPAPHGAAGDRQGDVVDGAAESVLDQFEVVEGPARPGEAAVGADVAVEGDPGGRLGQVPADLPEADDPVRRASHSLARVPGGVPEPAQGASEHAEEAARREAEEAGAGRRPLRLPGLFGANDLVFGLDVEEEHADVGRRDSVRHRVVGLVDDPEAVVLEPVGQPQLPERLGSVQRRRQVGPDQLVELRVGPGGGQSDVPDVPGDVEVGVIHPHRRPQMEGRNGEPLAQPREQVQAAADVGDEVLVAGRAALADHDRPDRHVAVRFLVGQEGRVERRQPVHMALGHLPSSRLSARQAPRPSPQDS